MSQELFKPAGEAVIANGHRYLLKRIWDEYKPTILFIGLNPSRADEQRNDPTITRCIGFAKQWGFGSLYFGNLYSFRTPYVKQADIDKYLESLSETVLEEYMKHEAQMWKPLVDNLDVAANENTDTYLQHMIAASSRVICAWGNWSFSEERIKQVIKLIPEPYCLGINKNGTPKHPLYLAKTTEPFPYERKN